MSWVSDAISVVTGAAEKYAPQLVKALGKMKDWKIGGWITAIQVGIMVISWLRKPDIPDSPNMDNVPEEEKLPF